MTRDEFVWVFIRFTGVVLLVLVILTLLGLVPMLVSMLNVPDSSTYGHTLSDQQIQEMNRATRKSVLSLALDFMPYIAGSALFGLYFLLGGKWVFKLVTRSSGN